MTKKRRYKAEDVADAILQADGFVSKAADILGCHVNTIYNYMQRYDAVQDAVNQVRERRHDFVENQLMRQIKEGNTTATIFYLKTQAKQRGYVERQEITGGDGKGLEVTINEMSDQERNERIRAIIAEIGAG